MTLNTSPRCACGALACYFEGPPIRQVEKAYCRACVPAGFLPAERGGRA